MSGKKAKEARRLATRGLCRSYLQKPWWVPQFVWRKIFLKIKL